MRDHLRGATPATDADRESLAAIFKELGLAIEQVVMTITLVDPVPTSRAARRVRGEPWRASGYVEALTAVAAGVNHLEALTVLVARPGPPLGASMQALARASCESFGRAWFLLRPDEDDTLQERRAALLYAELKYYDSDMVITGGPTGTGVMTVPEARLELQQEMGSLRAPTFTGLAKEVMKAAGLPQVDRLYTRLSSGAHGETLGTVGMHIEDPSDTDEFTTIGLPLIDADLIGNVAIECALLTTHALADEFAHLEIHARWVHHMREVATEFHALRTQWRSRLAPKFEGESPATPTQH